MKWLFLLLLIINFGIFAWGYRQEQLGMQPPIAAGADRGNMRLINEPKIEAEQAGPEPASEPAPEVTQTATEAVVETEPVQPSEKQAGDSATEPKPETEKITANTASGTEATIMPDWQAASIDTQATQPDAVSPTAENKVAETKSETTSRCGTIGPLKDRRVAKGVLEDLKKSKLEAKLEQGTEKKQIGYWVVIPPMPDGSQAQSKIEQLAKAGLKDIWHFRGGGLENAISLGMFSKKENAENFTREVQAKGFKTETKPRYLNKKHYLVKFTITKPKTVTGLMWRMVERKYSRMPFSEQSCEPIATR